MLGQRGKGYVEGRFSCFHLNPFPPSGPRFAVAFIGNSFPDLRSSCPHVFPLTFRGMYSRLSSLPSRGRRPSGSLSIPCLPSILYPRPRDSICSWGSVPTLCPSSPLPKAGHLPGTAGPLRESLSLPSSLARDFCLCNRLRSDPNFKNLF